MAFRWRDGGDLLLVVIGSPLPLSTKIMLSVSGVGSPLSKRSGSAHGSCIDIVRNLKCLDITFSPIETIWDSLMAKGPLARGAVPNMSGFSFVSCSTVLILQSYP